MPARRVPWVQAPPPSAFTRAERRVIDRLRTPLAVQAYLNAPALQHRARRGDAAQLPRRRAHGHGPLPRGRALRGRRPRTARVSAARPQLRVDRSARPRDLRVPGARPVGVGCAVARSRTARTQAALRHGAGPRAQLRRPVYGLHRRGPRLRRRGHARCSARTTGGSPTRTSGRPSACCSTTRTGGSRPRAPAIRQLRTRLPALPRRTPGHEAGVLPRPRALDAAARGIQDCRGPGTPEASRRSDGCRGRGVGRRRHATRVNPGRSPAWAS